jgi:hypothetical protein
MPAILINYNYDPEWLRTYPDLDVTLYDRSDDGVERNLTQYGKVYKTANVGDVDYDKLGWLIENYDTLPNVFLWGKSNLLKFVDEADLDAALERKVFAPLLKFDHKTYSDKFGVVCKYEGGIYKERADSWFFNATIPKYFRTWEDWCLHFGLPRESFIPFAPGGNYILTKERVHRYSRDFYAGMRDMLPHAQRPAEAQAAERSYYLMWR